jgi:hypothetical protein
MPLKKGISVTFYGSDEEDKWILLDDMLSSTICFYMSFGTKTCCFGQNTAKTHCFI